jgi:hypothetical protein
VRYIGKNKAEAFEEFSKLFPELKEKERVFNTYLDFWSTTIKVDKEGYKNACDIWKQNYPELLKEYVPYFKKASLADPVIEKINAREYRRDFPFLEDVLEKNIIEAIEVKKPLRLVGFWGGGKKSAPDEHDEKTINYFKGYIESICSTLAFGVEVTWILSDTHAKNNGYQEENYTKYLEEIKSKLEANGFQAIYLSKLWEKWNLTAQAIQEELDRQPADWWNKVSIAVGLEKQAQKRFVGKDFKLGAQKYYIMRKLEKPLLEAEFADCIFFSFNDGQTQSLLPTLPSVYIYSEERGVSDTPWFNNINN